MKLTTEQQASATKRLRETPEICAAFLHGSAASGKMRPDSDVDIAVLPMSGETIDVKTHLRLAGDLEQIFGRPADIGILSTNNLIYAKEVVEHGLPLFTKNKFSSDSFIMHCLSMYADLQESRKEVIHAYTA